MTREEEFRRAGVGGELRHAEQSMMRRSDARSVAERNGVRAVDTIRRLADAILEIAAERGKKLQAFALLVEEELVDLQRTEQEKRELEAKLAGLCEGRGPHERVAFGEQGWALEELKRRQNGEPPSLSPFVLRRLERETEEAAVAALLDSYPTELRSLPEVREKALAEVRERAKETVAALPAAG